MKKLGGAFLLACLACSTVLDIPADVTVTCASSNECPDGYRCDSEVCISVTGNAPPAVAVSAITRGAVSVPFAITVSDNDRDPVSVDVAVAVVSAAGEVGNYAPATLRDNRDLPSALGSNAHTIIWDALLDADTLGLATRPAAVDGATGERALLPARVKFRLTPRDATSAGRAIETALTDIGDAAGIVSIEPFSVPASGLVALSLKVTDAESDSTGLLVQFRTAPSEPWRAALIAVGAIDQVASSPSGSVHAVAWDSRAPASPDVATPQGVGNTSYDALELRVGALTEFPHEEVFGSFGGAATLEVVNQTKPRVASIVARRAVSNVGLAPITLTYEASDEESDPIRIRVSYSSDRGRSFAACDEYPAPYSEGLSGLATSPPAAGGLTHTFVWDPSRVLQSSPSTQLRIEAWDDASTSPTTTDFLFGGTVSTGPLTDVYSNVISVDPFPAAAGLYADHLDGDDVIDVVGLRLIGNALTLSTALGVAGDSAAGLASFAAPASVTWTYSGSLSFLRGVPADLDDDGRMDTLVTSAQVIGWFPNLGNGAFGAFQDLSALATGRNGSGCAADVTGDGLIDLVYGKGDMSGGGPGELVVLSATAPGVFDGTPKSTATLGPVRECLAIDLNSDGVSELITEEGDLAIYAASQSGVLTENERLATGNEVTGLVKADLDSDGIDDVVFGSATTNEIGFIAGSATGIYTLRTAATQFPASIVAAVDLDGDAVLDVVTSGSEFLRGVGGPLEFASGQLIGSASFARVAALPAVPGKPPGVLFGTVDSRSQIYVISPTGSGGEVFFNDLVAYPTLPTAFVQHVLDLDYDGRVDLLSASDAAVKLYPALGATPASTGLFDTTLPDVPVTSLEDLAIGDVDEDGYIDFAIAQPQGNAVTLLLTRPTEPSRLFDRLSQPYGESTSTPNDGGVIVIAQLDSAPGREVAIAYQPPSGSRLRIGRLVGGALVFGEPADFPDAEDLAAGDVDHDGDNDLVATSPSRSAVVACLNDGALGFASCVESPMALAPASSNFYFRSNKLALEDLDEDGVLDVAIAGSDGFYVALGDGTGLFPDVQPRLTTDRLDEKFSIGLGDATGDGVLDLIGAGTSDAYLMVGQASEGAADGSFAQPVAIDAFFVGATSPVLADVNGDTFCDVAGTNFSGPTFVTANFPALFTWQTRALSPTRSGGEFLSAPGLLAAGRDQLPPRVTYHPLRDGYVRYRENLRASLGTSLVHRVLTQPYAVYGDLALMRVADLGDGAARLRVVRRLDLDLATSNRGVIVPLPIPSSRGYDPSTVVVTIETMDWRRASEEPTDSMRDAPGSDRVLPRTTGVTGAHDLIAPRYTVVRVPRDDDGDLATGTGKRFVVQSDTVLVLTDELGIVQAFSQ